MYCSFRVMYESQFKIIDPYDWFCGPGSHIEYHILILTCVGWVSGRAVQEVRGAGQVGHATIAVAVHASGYRTVTALLRGGTGHISVWWYATRVTTETCSQTQRKLQLSLTSKAISLENLHPTHQVFFSACLSKSVCMSVKREKHLTLVSTLWRLGDVNGELSSEGVHSHHACMDGAVGEAGELVVVSWHIVQGFSNVCCSLKNDFLRKNDPSSLTIEHF